MKGALAIVLMVVAAAAAAEGAWSAVTPAILEELMADEAASPRIDDISYSIAAGALFNVANFSLTTHTGTHVDAPGHINQTLLEEGYDVDSLDLQTLNGPCVVVDVPRDSNITAEVMEELNIPRGVRRVLFRTLNTDRRLMHQPQFDGSYTGFTEGGARYLVENTDIRLVGIDYLSIGVAVEEELIGVHMAFLNTKVIIPVEALNLDNVVAGKKYTIHCLPLLLATLDGSPSRCVLMS